MTRRFGRLFVLASVQLVALVLAHQLVYLARYGSRYGEELAHSGHGGTWQAAVDSSLVLAALLAIAGGFRLARLWWQVRRSDAVATPGLPPLLSLLRAWRNAALWLLPLTIALLTIQENVERWSIDQPLPGIAVLATPQYAGGLWIALAVAGVVSLVVALFQWRRAALLAQLRAARAQAPRRAPAAIRRSGLDVQPPIESLLGRRSALRAPPLSFGS